jgi:hypothetical protein
MKYWMTTLFVVAVVLIACSVKLGSNSKVTMGDHELEIQPAAFSSTQKTFQANDQKTLTYRDARYTIRIQGGQLQVNGKDFGSLPAKAQILIDHGVVKVEGKSRGKVAMKDK